MKQQSIIKSLLKVIFVLILIIMLLVTCTFGIVTFGFSLWLHTYSVFTQKKLIAEVTTSKLYEENGIPYYKVTYKEIKQKSALEYIFSRDGDGKVEYGEVIQEDVYGDRLELGAEMVRWNDWVTFLGFDTVYKVSRLKGDYSNTELEKTAEHSVYDLNGGVDSFWKTLQKREKNLSFVVDSVYTSAALKFVEDDEVTWGLYITEDGLLLDRLN